MALMIALVWEEPSYSRKDQPITGTLSSDIHPKQHTPQTSLSRQQTCDIWPHRSAADSAEGQRRGTAGNGEGWGDNQEMHHPLVGFHS